MWWTAPARGDGGCAERTQRGQLRDAGDLCELSLEWRGNRCCHRIRARTLEGRGDLNSREVNLRQWSYRQEWVGDYASESQRPPSPGRSQPVAE
jgi:hypothetical protein